MSFLTQLFATRQLRGLKILLASILTAAEMLGLVLFDTAVTPRGQKLDLDGYALVFEDNFDGDELDLSKWLHRYPGRVNAGYQSPEQVSVGGGLLRFKALYREDGPYGPGIYSGEIRTRREFVRGYFEVRCLCSEGGGLWSAFWMNSDGMASAELSDGGLGGAEIDIFEANNYNANIFNRNAVTHAVHVGGYGEGLRSENEGSFKVPKPYSQFNTYGMEWTENEYIFYINSVESLRTSFQKGVSRVPEYVILTLCLPVEFPEENAGVTTDFVVDYVKIYQKDAA